MLNRMTLPSGVFIFIMFCADLVASSSLFGIPSVILITIGAGISVPAFLQSSNQFSRQSLAMSKPSAIGVPPYESGSTINVPLDLHFCKSIT